MSDPGPSSEGVQDENVVELRIKARAFDAIANDDDTMPGDHLADVFARLSRENERLKHLLAYCLGTIDAAKSTLSEVFDDIRQDDTPLLSEVRRIVEPEQSDEFPTVVPDQGPGGVALGGLSTTTPQESPAGSVTDDRPDV